MTKKLIPLKDLIALDNVQQFSNRPAQNIDRIKNSISTDGLLNPLVVIKQDDQYVVMDGKKRLKAIRQLVKAQKQTQAFNKILCVVQESPQDPVITYRRPELMTGPKLAHAIITQINLGFSDRSTAQRFDCDLDVIEDAVSLKRLHPKLLANFSNLTISLEQAAALATIPNLRAQLNLFQQLGTFASDVKIIAAIKSGETVIELPDGNVIILPSRNIHPTQTPENRKVLKDNVYSLSVVAA